MKLGPKKMNILLYDLSTKTTRVKEDLESKWRSDNVNLLTCRTESILKTGFKTAKPLSNGQSVSFYSSVRKSSELFQRYYYFCNS